MKPRNREVNVFNLSMLDVIAGALGAILIIMVVLFPHYGKERTEDEFNRLSRELQEAKRRLNEVEADAKKGRVRNPVVVMAEWYTAKHDVDLFLHSSTQKAPPYNPSTKQRPHYSGDVKSFFETGPGHEIFVMRDTPPGSYEIYLNLYDRKGNAEAARVGVFFLYEQRMFKLAVVKLREEKKAVLIGSLIMNGGRKLSFKGATAEIQREFDRNMKR